MAGISRPSFNKKQKEQKRLAKAAGKREAREARRRAQKAGDTPLETPPSLESPQPSLESPPPPEGEAQSDGESPA